MSLSQYSYNQKTAKSLELNIDLLRLRGILNCSAPISFQDCLIAGNCSVGAFTYFGKGCEIRNTNIGSYCSISAEVIINPFQHPTHLLSTSGFAFGDNGGLGWFEAFKKIKSKVYKSSQGYVDIGSDVWIGRRVIIMSGIKIGAGAIIAANSVVTKNVAPYNIVGGVPARVIGKRFDENVATQLLDSNWFEYIMDKDLLPNIDYSNVVECIKVIEQQKMNLNRITKNITVDRKNKIITVDN